MPGNKRKRKAYRPKPMNPDAIANALAAHVPMEMGKQQDVQIVAHQSLTALESGMGTEFDAEHLAVAMNLSMLLAEMGVGREYLPLAIAGQEAVVRCQERAKRLGKWGLDGPAITALRDALELHDEQAKAATQKQMSAAVKEMHRRASVSEYVMKVENKERSPA
ncbi:conserved hypothetical protein [Cupriavidus necator]|uniref:Uncharacterized protein n=1 Tax=Cupriavidus necator TaxID=106590 RepID=A0A1K0J8Y7_CUPNE|nr:conserved hypothetical protein [Cupriavidus necator]